MGWNKTLPTTATAINDSPAIFQANWAALEDWTNTEHYSLTNAASGKHLPGLCGVLYVGTTTQINALSGSAPACAVAFDTTLGAFKYYSTAATAWSICQLDWDNVWTDAVHTHASNAEGGQLDWDTALTDAVHSHASNVEGGQLDWDDVWSDAVHDHSSNAEGGVLTSTASTLTFLTTPVNKINWTAATNWTDVDISANTGGDTAKAALLAVELSFSNPYGGSGTSKETGLFRKNGSSETAVLSRIKGSCHSTAAGQADAFDGACNIIVECDGAEIFEVSLSESGVTPAGIVFKVDLIGYFK